MKMLRGKDEGGSGGSSEVVSEILYNPGCFSAINLLSFQSFDICGRVGGVRKALKLLCTSQVSRLHVVLAKVTGTRSQEPETGLSVLLGVHNCVCLSLPSHKQNYGVRATGQQCTEAGDICAICQAEFREPLILMCQVSRAGQGHQRLRLGDRQALPQAEVSSAFPLTKP